MGDILKRGQKWAIRYFDAEGKRRVKTTAAMSHSEARKLLAQAEADVSRGVVTAASASTMTVAELCERFLASAHPRAKDAERYRKAAGYSLVRVLPVVGAIPLSKLRRRDLEGLRDKLMARYKPNTLAAALRPLAAALTWAVRQELIPASPMVGLKLPRKTSSTDRLSAEEAGRLLDLARSQRTDAMQQARYVAVCLALRLGLRFGEIFGLRWVDVDLPRRRLTVARSFDRTPKSGKPRTVPLPATWVDELAQWRTICPKSAAGLVCPLGAKRAAAWLADLLKAIGCTVPIRPWHTLRHTFASLFVESGGSIVALKDILGHGSLDMTLIYSHVAPDALARDMDKLKL
ncbi:MAG TPA: site-specific integrase [Pseudomonadota bacterium]|nr:site-specific integrase [Pseudomonadota bacterium]